MQLIVLIALAAVMQGCSHRTVVVLADDPFMTLDATTAEQGAMLGQIAACPTDNSDFLNTLLHWSTGLQPR